MIEVLTNSKRRDFLNCRRYFYNRHELHLTPRLQKTGRRKGTIFGDVLFDVREAVADGRITTDDQEGLHDLVLNRVTEEYSELEESGLLSPQALADMEVEQVKLRVMAERYAMKYGVDTRRELEFVLPFKNPNTGRSSRTYRLGGKIDGMIVLDGHHAIIVEDKLVAQIQKAMISRLPLDHQATEYVDALVSRGWHATVAYRHTRWPGISPKPPKEFKTKADYPGETLIEYEERLWQDVCDRDDFYFDQQVLDFPVTHLEEHRLERWQIGKDIQAARVAVKDGTNPHQVFYKNPSRCWEYGGCEFIPLCTGEEDAPDLYITTQDNPELSQVDEGVTSVYGTHG